MRRTRRLTTNERWELGLFLAMMVVGCLCVTAILNVPGFPRLFAVAFHTTPTESEAAMAVTPTPTLAAFPTAPSALDIGSSAPGALALPQVTVAPSSPTFSPFAPAPELPVAPRSVHKKAPEVKWYNGEKYRFVKTLRLRVTAYAPDPRCCWPYPGTTTASGMSVKTNRGRLVAADTRVIPMHALVSVPGYVSGAPVPVLDRGGAIKGKRLDVLMPTFDRAKEWGSHYLDVKIYMPVDED